MNKKIAFILISISTVLFLLYKTFIYSISIGAGTLGGSKKIYKYDCTRGELQNCLAQKALEYNVPNKWKVYDNWHEKGYDFLNGVVFYFEKSNNEKEEMYYVTLVSKLLEDTTYTKPSYLSIRSVLDNKNNIHQWKDMGKFDSNEIERIERRFKNEILDNIKSDSCFCNLIEIQNKK